MPGMSRYGIISRKMKRKIKNRKPACNVADVMRSTAYFMVNFAALVNFMTVSQAAD